MELKKYQGRVLNDLDSYANLYDSLKNPSNAYKQYWRNIGIETGTKEMPNYVDSVPGIPNVTLKVPTGGGKTFLACAAISIIESKNFSKCPINAVVWLVPSDPILKQTLKALQNINHPYRQYLDREFNHRINIYSKEDALNAINLNVSTVKENLSIFVFSYSSFKDTKDGRKSRKENSSFVEFKQSYQDSGYPLDNAEEYSLLQTINYFNPLVIIDESHNADTTLSIEMIKDFNPSFVLDLTATPKENSNIISFVDAKALKKEEMIKLPLLVYNRYDKDEVLATAIDLQKKLELTAEYNFKETGRYIRPIVLFQAQERGDGNMTYQEIKEKLLSMGIPKEQIKIKVSDLDEISSLDLLSDQCSVRFIITVNALKEGWDCPFAYVLASIANRSSKIDVEQVIGRVLRLPYTKLNDKAPLLNSSYVITSSSNFFDTAQSISEGLKKSGYSDSDYRLVNPNDFINNPVSKDENTEGELEGLFGGTAASWDNFEKKDGENGNNDNSLKGEQENSPVVAVNPQNLSNYNEAEIKAINENFTSHGTTADDIVQAAETQTKEFENQIKQKPDDGISEEVKSKMKTSKLKPGFAVLAKEIKIPQFYKIASVNSLFGGEDKLLTKGMLDDGYRLDSATLPKNLTEVTNNVFVYDIDEQGSAAELSRSAINLHDSDWGKVLSLYDDDQKITAVVQRVTMLLDRKFNCVSTLELKTYLDRLFKDFSVDDLDHVISNTNVVTEAIKRHIQSDIEKHRIEKFSELLAKNTVQVRPSFEFLPEINSIDTSAKIAKSLYESEPSINPDEEKAITNIASLDNVVFWHHIRQKEVGEFYINGYINHYPDFVIYTKKGNIILVEFKGEDRKNEDSQLKVKLGKKWADLSSNKFSYFMVFLKEAFKEDGAYNLADALDIIRSL